MSDSGSLPSTRSMLPKEVKRALPKGLADDLVPLAWSMFVAGYEHAALQAQARIDMLEARISRRAYAGIRPSPIRMWAVTIKAWNAYRAGEPIKLLRYSPGGAKPESFPVAR